MTNDASETSVATGSVAAAAAGGAGGAGGGAGADAPKAVVEVEDCGELAHASITIDKEHVDAVLNHTVGDETCAELSRFEAGFVNVVYFVTCTSGAQFVLRLTNPLKKWRHIKTTHEVTLIAFLRKHTNIPLPDICAYTTDAASALGKLAGGYEFLLMRRARGVALDSVWNDPSRLAPSLRTHVLDQIADFVACLQSLRWPAIGSFLDDMSVGPDVDINLGPFTSGTEYYSAETRESLLGVKVKPEYASLVPRIEAYLTTVAAKIVAPTTTTTSSTTTSSDVTARFFEINDMPAVCKSADAKFALSHCDIAPKNMIVDPATGNITAFLDWEWAGPAPRPTDVLDLLDCDSELFGSPAERAHMVAALKQRGVAIPSTAGKHPEKGSLATADDVWGELAQVARCAMTLACYQEWFKGSTTSPDAIACANGAKNKLIAVLEAHGL